ncbi:Phosphatidylinositol 3,5-bisphosphate-binding protein [Ascosphaera pollenicola]|nr:Phosphatidylinositol 3,5-bisphosphate-binding protein [Ascosphaera pollenicola]
MRVEGVEGRAVQLILEADFNAGIGLASMLGQTNYLALVGGGRKPKFPQNKMIIWDDSKQRVVITLEFRTSVLRTLLSKTLIVVALRNSIEIYQFSTAPRKIHEFETGDNSQDGLVCLGPEIVAFPGRTAGQVQLVELKTGNVSIIPAHETRLRALALSRDGLLLATAGEKGTLIRLYATSNCAKIAEFRRGIDPAEIYSIAFNPSNSLLAVTSDKSTLHIFDLPTPQNIIRWQTRTTHHYTNHHNHSHNHNHHSQQPHPPLHPSNTSDRASLVSGTSNAIVPAATTTSIDRSKNKWGFLQNVPLLPRLFSDTYSFASAAFELGDEPLRTRASA